MTIAQTILQQLGGNRFIAMTGAKFLVDTGDGISFSIGRGAKNKANKVRVVLGADDLYTVEFWKLNQNKCTADVVSTHEGVYADALARLFTEQTGMDTRL